MERRPALFESGRRLRSVVGCRGGPGRACGVRKLSRPGLRTPQAAESTNLQGKRARAVRLFLQVRDLRMLRQELEAKGVVVAEEPELKPWGLLEMVARDPDGLALVFVEVPPEHPLRRRS
jgi:hypothetical protein